MAASLGCVGEGGNKDGIYSGESDRPLVKTALAYHSGCPFLCSWTGEFRGIGNM